MGIIRGSQGCIIEVIRGDTRSLDYGSKGG